MTITQTTLELRPIAGRIGAAVDGLQLSGDLDDGELAALEQALLEYKVLFFRDQHRLGPDEHEALARRLGEPVAHPTVPSADGRYTLAVDAADGVRATQWHADVTFVPNYPKISILRAEVAPEQGGDTLWADAEAAYAELPESLRELADALRAIHTNDFDYAEPTTGERAEKIREYGKTFTRTLFRTEHPLVRVHPVSGRRSLLLGNFVREIVGVSRRDGRLLIDLFQGHVERPENVVRWRWRAGDVAIWDNRATQHRAIDDFADQPRQLFRQTLEGEVPVGVDGRESRLLDATA
jgi:alpha-ketoglutarate-dependent sulfate ester dioxygenase